MTLELNEIHFHPLKKIGSEIRKKRYRLATRRGYLELLKNVMIMVILIGIAFTQVFLITAAKGTDMFPMVLDGDIVLGYRLDHDYRKNDVVVYDFDGKRMIGRVIAKGQDSVDITEDGRLYVNGTEQAGEIVFATSPGNQDYPYQVPDGCVYILGDYRPHTMDSREIGPVNVKQVKAKVVSIFRRRGI